MTAAAVSLVAALCGAAAAPAVLAAAPRHEHRRTAAGRRPGRRSTAALLGAAAGLSVLLTLVVSPGRASLVEAFVAGTMVLVSAVDLRVGRLPNVAVMPAIGVSLALLVQVEVSRPAAGSLLRALVVAVLVLVGLTVTALLLPGRFGMGDTRFTVLPVVPLAYGAPWSVSAFFLLLAGLAAAATTWALSGPDGRQIAPLGPLITVAYLLTLWGDGIAQAYWTFAVGL